MYGNMTTAEGPTFIYNAKNELVEKSGSAMQFYHDPLGRLGSLLNAPGGTYAFQYAEGQIANQYGPGTSITRRYVYGPGVDEPILWYEGSGLATKRYLIADERGSIVALTTAGGAKLAINKYDEYGIPRPGNSGRFQYTGQAWIPELGMYSYRARIYSPTLGRFMQTDPIGYADGPNWYNYVGSDPVNRIDPTGTEATDEILVNACRSDTFYKGECWSGADFYGTFYGTKPGCFFFPTSPECWGIRLLPIFFEI